MISSKMSETDFHQLKRKDSNKNVLCTPPEKSARPTSLFRMGGKLFQDGSSREKQKAPGENRVRSLSSSGRTSMFSSGNLLSSENYFYSSFCFFFVLFFVHETIWYFYKYLFCFVFRYLVPLFFSN
jgi:hypothetical protein